MALVQADNDAGLLSAFFRHLERSEAFGERETEEDDKTVRYRGCAN